MLTLTDQTPVILCLYLYQSVETMDLERVLFIQYIYIHMFLIQKVYEQGNRQRERERERGWEREKMGARVIQVIVDTIIALLIILSYQFIICILITLYGYLVPQFRQLPSFMYTQIASESINMSRISNVAKVKSNASSYIENFFIYWAIWLHYSFRTQSGVSVQFLGTCLQIT